MLAEDLCAGDASYVEIKMLEQSQKETQGFYTGAALISY